jgi:hypothetical protein
VRKCTIRKTHKWLLQIMISKIQIGMAIHIVLHFVKWKKVDWISAVIGIRVAMKATATTKKSKGSRGAMVEHHPAATSTVPVVHK